MKLSLHEQKVLDIVSNHPEIIDNPQDRTRIAKIYNLTEKTLRSFDCILLLTDHDEFPYELIKNNSNLIIDTRGRFDLSDNIFRA